MSMALSHLTNRLRHSTSCHYTENTHAQRNCCRLVIKHANIFNIFNPILERQKKNHITALKFAKFARCMHIQNTKNILNMNKLIRNI